MSSSFPTLTHWRTHIDADGILHLTLDTADSSTNILRFAVREELRTLLTILEKTPPKNLCGIMFVSAKKTGFIAGADIGEFGQFNTADKVQGLVQEGWDLMNRIARLPLPTLALIDGHCLGGGLELALACRYRVVTENAKMGLPEVLIGIVPGWGGMSRLPLLIGAPAALQMMLTGKALDGKRAWRAGLADACVPLRVAKITARALILKGEKSGLRRAKIALPTRIINTLSNNVLKPWVAHQARLNTAKKVSPQNYPAPFTLIDIWAKHGGDATHCPELVAQLMRPHPDYPKLLTAQSLQRVFHLQERLKALGKVSDFRAQSVHVIGAGVMGGDIAIHCAHKGLRVSLQDTDTKKIAETLARAQKFFSKRLRDPLRVRAAMDRLIPDSSGAGVRHADVVIEAVVENLSVKHQIFAAIEPMLKPTALIASNTSSLKIEDMASVLKNPARLIGIHFFNPVTQMPLVEVVSSTQTSPNHETSLQAAMAFVRQIDKLPLPVKSAPGFLVNAVLGPYMARAMRMVDAGHTPANIDAAMRAFGMPMGPLELIDMVGLDVALAAGAAISGEDARPPACLQTRVNAGQLGRKTGQGFYVWTNGKVSKINTKTSPNAAEIAHELVQVLIQSSEKQVASGVVADADLADAGMIFGAGFAPYTGGPLNFSRALL